MEGIVDEKEKTPCGRFRFVVGLVSLLSLSTFVILAAIRISADSRGTSIGGIVLDWIKILIPFYIFAVTLFVYGLANYILSAPNIGMSGGHGGQFYYNLLGQLLVRDLGYKSLENFNEGAVLRGLLRGVVYTLIIAYSAMASALECKNCDVPYKMLSVGFLVTYFFRLIMLLYNGFYSYHRLLAMTEEVRSYQESLVRIFCDRPALRFEFSFLSFLSCFSFFLSFDLTSIVFASLSFLATYLYSFNRTKPACLTMPFHTSMLPVKKRTPCFSICSFGSSPSPLPSWGACGSAMEAA